MSRPPTPNPKVGPGELRRDSRDDPPLRAFALRWFGMSYAAGAVYRWFCRPQESPAHDHSNKRRRPSCRPTDHRCASMPISAPDAVAVRAGETLRSTVRLGRGASRSTYNVPIRARETAGQARYNVAPTPAGGYLTDSTASAHRAASLTRDKKSGRWRCLLRRSDSRKDFSDQNGPLTPSSSPTPSLSRAG